VSFGGGHTVLRVIFLAKPKGKLLSTALVETDYIVGGPNLYEADVKPVVKLRL